MSRESSNLVVARYYSRVPVLGSLLQVVAAVWAVRRHRDLLGDVDVVHAHIAQSLPAAVVVAHFLRRPLVLSEHSSQHLRADPSHFGCARKSVLSLLGRSVRAWSAVSEPLRDSIAAQRTVPKGAGIVIPNVIASEFALGTEDRRPRSLLWVGALRSEKDPALLLEAVERIERPLRVLFVGDGPLAADVQAAINRSRHRDGLELQSSIEPDELADLMRRASALVVTSRFETFSAVAAEALACGTPVVTTRCGGPETFVGSGDGVIIRSRSSTDVAAAVERAFACAWNHAEIASRAAVRFGSPTIAAQFEQMYRSAVA